MNYANLHKFLEKQDCKSFGYIFFTVTVKIFTENRRCSLGMDYYYDNFPPRASAAAPIAGVESEYVLT